MNSSRGIEFGYWHAKARAHYIRMLIAYLGLEVNEVTYKTPQEWGQKKQELAKSDHCPFPNLPYLVDGEIVITETVAICKALVLKASRPEMFGKTPADQVTHLSMMGVCADLFSAFIAGPFKQNLEELRKGWPQFLEKNNITQKLEGFCKTLGSRPFLLFYLTVADLQLTYMYDFFEYLSQQTGVRNPFADYPPLVNLHRNVWALPGLKGFMIHRLHRKIYTIPQAMAPYTTYDELEEVRKEDVVSAFMSKGKQLRK